MDKKVAIVTGGATGIGAACVRALAAAGFHVGIHYRTSAEKAQALLGEISGGFLLQADLAAIDEIDRMMGEIKEAVRTVDVLVNNAGQSVNADIISMKVEQFDEQRAMSRGAGTCQAHFAPVMMRAGHREGSSIIFQRSGHTATRSIAYTMEKAALDAFTKSLAQKWGSQIFSEPVAPGVI